MLFRKVATATQKRVRFNTTEHPFKGDLVQCKITSKPGSNSFSATLPHGRGTITPPQSSLLYTYKSLESIESIKIFISNPLEFSAGKSTRKTDSLHYNINFIPHADGSQTVYFTFTTAQVETRYQMRLDANHALMEEIFQATDREQNKITIYEYRDNINRIEASLTTEPEIQLTPLLESLARNDADEEESDPSIWIKHQNDTQTYTGQALIGENAPPEFHGVGQIACPTHTLTGLFINGALDQETPSIVELSERDTRCIQIGKHTSDGHQIDNNSYATYTYNTIAIEHFSKTETQISSEAESSDTENESGDLIPLEKATQEERALLTDLLHILGIQIPANEAETLTSAEETALTQMRDENTQLRKELAQLKAAATAEQHEEAAEQRATEQANSTQTHANTAQSRACTIQ